MFYEAGYGGMHNGWWLFWLLIGLAVLLFGGFGRQWRGGRSVESPHDLLRRRLANGDITPQQYGERKLLLDRPPRDDG